MDEEFETRLKSCLDEQLAPIHSSLAGITSKIDLIADVATRLMSRQNDVNARLASVEEGVSVLVQDAVTEPVKFRPDRM